MSRDPDIDRTLADVIELRLIASKISEREPRVQLARLVRRMLIDIGPSVPKARAAKVLGVTVPALNRWVKRGALKTRRATPNAEQIDTLSLVDLAVEIASLAQPGQKSRRFTEALTRRERANESRGMGTRGFLPDQQDERRQEFASLSAGERVAEVIRLSRTATKIAAAGARAKADQDKK